jgi:hypothetical protein
MSATAHAYRQVKLIVAMYACTMLLQAKQDKVMMQILSNFVTPLNLEPNNKLKSFSCFR